MSEWTDAIINREATRDRLKELMEAEALWAEVHAYQPSSLDSKSPVATIHNGSLELTNLTGRGGRVQANYELLVTNLVRRDAAPAAAEDELDALLSAVAGLIMTHAEGGPQEPWNHAWVAGPTEPDYYTIDGIAYRGEIIRVQFQAIFTKPTGG
jgi:hypothetical protein